MLEAHDRVSISAGKLRKWQTELAKLHDVRYDLERLRLSRSEAREVDRIMTQLKNIEVSMQAEIREKLQG